MLSFDEFRQLCEYRRSIRYFSDKEVTEHEVRQLLELANLAPNVQNTQPWRFHVIFDSHLRHRLTEAVCYGNFVEGNGVFIVVTADMSVQEQSSEILWNPQELEYSCVAAMLHILLGASALGLGGTWVSLQNGPVHDALALPRGQKVIGGILIGHLKKGEERPGAGHQRKAAAASISFYR